MITEARFEEISSGLCFFVFLNVLSSLFDNKRYNSEIKCTSDPSPPEQIGFRSHKALFSLKQKRLRNLEFSFCSFCADLVCLFRFDLILV